MIPFGLIPTAAPQPAPLTDMASAPGAFEQAGAAFDAALAATLAVIEQEAGTGGASQDAPAFPEWAFPATFVLPIEDPAVPMPPGAAEAPAEPEVERESEAAYGLELFGESTAVAPQVSADTTRVVGAAPAVIVAEDANAVAASQAQSVTTPPAEKPQIARRDAGGVEPHGGGRWQAAAAPAERATAAEPDTAADADAARDASQLPPTAARTGATPRGATPVMTVEKAAADVDVASAAVMPAPIKTVEANADALNEAEVTAGMLRTAPGQPVAQSRVPAVGTPAAPVAQAPVNVAAAAIPTSATSEMTPAAEIVVSQGTLNTAPPAPSVRGGSEGDSASARIGIGSDAAFGQQAPMTGDEQFSQGGSRRSLESMRFAAVLSQVATTDEGGRSGGHAFAPTGAAAAPAAPAASIAPAAPAAPATPMAAADTPDAENLGRLVHAMRINARPGAWEATVRLKPEHLGEVTIALRVERNAVSAVVNAEAAGVRQWLESQEQAVRSGMAEHGLQLERFVVQRDGQRKDAQPQEHERRRQPRRQPEAAERFEIVV